MDRVSCSDGSSRLPGGSSTVDKHRDSGISQFIRAVTEGMALLVGLMAIETLFLGRGTYGSFDIHPFWLPVMLVALQHGLYGGVVTAILASFFMDWPLRPPGMDISAFYLEVARLPIQWLLGALLIGLFRQNHLRIEAERVKELTRLREMTSIFADEIQRLDKELWQYEVTVATRLPSELALGSGGEPEKPEKPENDERSAALTHGRAETGTEARPRDRVAADPCGADDPHRLFPSANDDCFEVCAVDSCATRAGTPTSAPVTVSQALEIGTAVVIESADGSEPGHR